MTGNRETIESSPALIAHSDTAFADFLAHLLQRLALPVVCATTGAEALAQAPSLRPALIVLDVGLPDLSGVEVCRELREELGEVVPIILVSGEKTDDRDRAAGLLLGADDYLVKPVDPTLFIARVRRLVARAVAADTAGRRVAGDRRLTPREQEVLNMLADGHDRVAIARVLVISPRTVGSHIERLLTKLGVHSQAQAVAAAHRDGLLGATAGERTR